MMAASASSEGAFESQSSFQNSQNLFNSIGILDVDDDIPPTGIASFQIQGADQPCYVFKPEGKDVFLEWWKKTKWYADHREGTAKKILWGTPKQSNAWKWYVETATKRTGEPRVVCQRCSHTIQHPSMGNGTKALGEHVKTKLCKKAAIGKGLEALSKEKGYRQSVSYDA